jgi:hypothetical protein
MAGCTRQSGTMLPQERVPPLENSWLVLFAGSGAGTDSRFRIRHRSTDPFPASAPPCGGQWAAGAAVARRSGPSNVP